MKILFLFLDGVGLGSDDPSINPLVRAAMPHFDALLDGAKICSNGHQPDRELKSAIVHASRASLIALDATLGVDGLPQSATGQASLLTGKNASALIGFHDGPKPSPQVLEILQAGTLFSQLKMELRQPALLNAFPPRYFRAIQSGHRLPGTIAQAALLATLPLKTRQDLIDGRAISADFTGQGWREQLGFSDTPLLDPRQAGERLADLTDGNDLAFFEYWPTDISGHHQDMQSACELLQLFDLVIGSLVNTWDPSQGMILITSDHGNLEDMSTRHHTRNEVPLILIGSMENRQRFINELAVVSGKREKLNLTDVTPAILRQFQD